MKDSILSVLVFSYDNLIEIRVSRGYAFNTRPTRINIYHAAYGKKAHRLVDLANKLNGLVLHKMVDRVRYVNPLA